MNILLFHFICYFDIWLFSLQLIHKWAIEKMIASNLQKIFLKWENNITPAEDGESIYQHTYESATSCSN